jgi:Uma2 family endonuclease
MVLQQKISITEFDAYISQHPEGLYQLIGGEIVDVVSRQLQSEIAAEIIYLLKAHLKQHNLKGRVTSSDAGFAIGDDRYIPDAALSFSERSDDAYHPVAPELAVEVISPGNTVREIGLKIAAYAAAGTLLWIVYPDEREVHVYVPGSAAKVLMDSDMLTGGEVLPGFAVSVHDIFPD